MGYVRGFIHGAIAGTAIGVCVAPQPGSRTRAQLSGLAEAAQSCFHVARRTAQRVAPLAAGAASAAREKVERTRRHDNGHGLAEIEGSLPGDSGWRPER